MLVLHLDPGGELAVRAALRQLGDVVDAVHEVPGGWRLPPLPPPIKGMEATHFCLF